jgi:hypothetical protein
LIGIPVQWKPNGNRHLFPFSLLYPTENYLLYFYLNCTYETYFCLKNNNTCKFKGQRNYNTGSINTCILVAQLRMRNRNIALITADHYTPRLWHASTCI